MSEMDFNDSVMILGFAEGLHALLLEVCFLNHFESLHPPILTGPQFIAAVQRALRGGPKSRRTLDNVASNVQGLKMAN